MNYINDVVAANATTSSVLLIFLLFHFFALTFYLSLSFSLSFSLISVRNSFFHCVVHFVYNFARVLAKMHEKEATTKKQHKAVLTTINHAIYIYISSFSLSS